MSINLDDYVRGHGDPPPNVQEAAIGLLSKVNSLLSDPTCPVPDPGVRSGWRPADYNKTVLNAAPNSKHITGHAVDLNDPDAFLDDWLDLYDLNGGSENAMLEKYGLYREAPGATKSWCHLQDIAPNSGRRTFNP